MFTNLKLRKMKTLKYLTIISLYLIILVGCEKPLDENIYSRLAPSTLLTTEDGINSVMNSSYSYAHRNNITANWSAFYLGGMPTGEIWGKGGSIETLWNQLSEFTWDANHAQILPLWETHYSSIRDANVVLDNLEGHNFSSEFISLKTAEAKFLRGWSYSELYNLFGRLPLYTSSSDNPLQARATDEETKAQIESDLLGALSGLPIDNAFGKATKGATRGILCKYYLNTRQWQKAADMANDIINMGKYALQANYSDVFALNNEGNNEMLWALTKNSGNANTANAVQALTFPPAYPRPYPNNAAFAARTYLFDSFVNSFNLNDTRRKSIVTDWKLADGTPQAGLGIDQSFPNKYPWDPTSLGALAGNDVPIVRYADVLLSRAEALNEISGPTQEVINLINQVRTRAKITSLSLAGFSKASLRDAIIQERGWEFFYEFKSREDLLRHDLFISRAQARGKNAKSFHVLYPIPQVEIDANELLKDDQNPGY